MRSLAAVSILSLILIGAPRPAAAEEQQPAAAQSSKSKGGHRTLWTVVGIGAGFVGGMLIGLNQFDDAINSDQKVWMSAIAGAAAGGLAGNLLSANQASTPGFKPPRAPKVDPAGVGTDARLRKLIARLGQSGNNHTENSEK